jgi:transposase-like protein
VTRLGTIRLRIARARGRNFIPTGLEKFQRRAEDVAMLIREAFLRGISTRQVGRMRNILETVRKRDYDQVKADAQAIYRAPNGMPFIGFRSAGGRTTPVWSSNWRKTCRSC